MKNADINFLSDQLANSMEFYTEQEFCELSEETEFTPEQLKKIWDAYWDLDALERFQMGFTEDEFPELINETLNL